MPAAPAAISPKPKAAATIAIMNLHKMIDE
jgi:hypothetical protein